MAAAAEELAARLRSLAALRANCAPDELLLADGEVRRADGTPVCATVALLGEAFAATGRFQPTNTFVAEVEVDPATGIAILARYLAVDDAGVTIDTKAAEAQIHGGIARGLGEVLSEDAVLDAAGQLVAASLMDYALPAHMIFRTSRCWSRSTRSG